MRQDLNPQPPVLETGALPVELLTYCSPFGRKKRRLVLTSVVHNLLFCLFVKSVSPASRTVLFVCNTIWVKPLILRQRIVAPMTLRTFQSQQVSLAVRAQFYSTISVTTPAPTVRPPSRMANLNSFSMAIGAINSTSNVTLSPGITISVPSGRSDTPVTSVVRK